MVSYPATIFTVGFMLQFGIVCLSGQINVDNRIFEPVPWFDSLYKNCGSIQQELLSEKHMVHKTDTDILYKDFIMPMLQKAYHDLSNDLEKRKLYWEIEDLIWDFGLADTLTTRLAKNYARAIRQDFSLWKYADKISNQDPDDTDLQLIRQIYTLDKYNTQLNDRSGNQISFRLDASEERPAIHPVLIIENTRSEISEITLNGETLLNGSDFKIGIEKAIDQERSVLWINKEISNNSHFLIKFTPSCNPSFGQPTTNPAVLEPLKEIASTEGFKPYKGNPVLTPGPQGAFDAGALGSMSVLKVGDIFHMYYETWGVRSDLEWDADEYESLQIGHATSSDGIHWSKDPNNPVLPQGGEADFDRTGVWDPYVIFEDGIFKMWYGGGGGSQPNFGWAYATSEDGSHFDKKGLIGIGNQTGVEDCHVVFDKVSGLYFMYYWHGWSEPEGLFLVTSPTETGFDFNEAVNIHIEGDDSYMKKFGHVLRDEHGWHMFYSNFVQPHCPNSITRYAYSTDGIHWQAKNKRLVKGHDSEVLQVSEDLCLMYSSPQNGFDRTGTDVRLSAYHGTFKDLASKPPFFELPPPSPLEGRKFTIVTGEDPPATYYFKPEGEVVLSEEWNKEDPYTFNAYYIHEGQQVHIMGEGIDLTGSYDGETLTLTENKTE